MLRPKLVLARYRAADPQWWRTATLDRAQGLWGGEVAAAKQTGYLKPEVVTIYRLGNMAPWLLEHRLTSVSSGYLIVLSRSLATGLNLARISSAVFTHTKGLECWL